ncbi:hypothetical protein ACN3XK_71270 [Actinomadura welshii]
MHATAPTNLRVLGQLGTTTAPGSPEGKRTQSAGLAGSIQTTDLDEEACVHVLDDLAGFSDRAQGLLTRTGRREPDEAARTPTDLLDVHDRVGRVVPAPTALVVRREGFDARYGGLRYEVRRSVLVSGERWDVCRRWDFSLDEGIWADDRGWFFSWKGEHVSTPVRFLVHTDGRVGVSDGGPFIEVASSVPQLIESHAVMDMVSSWDPWPSALEPLSVAMQKSPVVAGVRSPLVAR